MMRLNIDVRKTVVLFVAIHLLIAWVAERREVRTEQQLNHTKSAAFTSKAGKMDKQDDIGNATINKEIQNSEKAGFKRFDIAKN